MAAVGHSRSILQLAERAALEASDPADAELLARFHNSRDEVSFELLVRRHGALVYRVCRGRLGSDADAADVFQATFLALARAAGRINGTSLAGWLYRVAFRLSNKLRAQNRPTVELTPNHPAIDGDPAHLASQREDLALLWAEIDRLPRGYRDAVLLCLIEGKTRAQAASELSCPGGTIDSRLAWARERLRERLLRRGVAPAAVTTLFATLSADAFPPHLATGLSRLALLVAAGGPAALRGLVAPQTVNLLQSMGSIMTRTKAKVALALAFALGVAGIITHGRLDRPAVAENPPPAAGKAQEAGEWRYLGKFNVGTGPVSCLMFAPNAKLLIASGTSTEGERRSGLLTVRMMPDGKPQMLELGQPAQSLAFSPDGKLVAVAGRSGSATLWRLGATLEVDDRMRFEGVTSLTFSPDGKRLFLGTRDTGVWFWDPAGGPSDMTKRFFGVKPGLVDGLTFTPDGQRLFTSGDGTIRVWDANTGKQISEAADWNRGKRDVAVSPDGKLVAVAAPTHVTLLDVPTGQAVRTIEVAAANSRGKDICAVVFLPDGRTLAVGCNPYLSDEPAGVGEVRLFDVTTGKKTGELKLPAGFVVKVAVSSDGTFVVAGAHDGTVHAWQRTSAAAPAKPRPAGNRLTKLADELATSSRSPEQCIEALFLATLGRFPTDTERQFTAAHVSKAQQRREALHDVLFQLIHTRDFADHAAELRTQQK